MKSKNVALTFFTILLSMLSGCPGVGVTTDYPSAVMWNDTLYLGSGDILSEDEVEEISLGIISKQVSKMPTKHGESNEYPVGRRVVGIKGLSLNEAIAVEDNGQYRVFTSSE